MKLQYLGDSKDAFKWDYLDFLVNEFGAPILDVIPMMTLPDASTQGTTSPSQFPASAKVEAFCRHLQRNRELAEISKLPRYMGREYKIRLHKPNIEFQNSSEFRVQYFSDIPFENSRNRVLFLDPDIGFQPPKTVNEKHIKYSDISTIWGKITDRTLVCVFQHGRQMHYPFEDHYREISRGLKYVRPLHSTAIYWSRKLMFVLLGKLPGQIKNAHIINEAYQQKQRPVQLISNQILSQREDIGC